MTKNFSTSLSVLRVIAMLGVVNMHTMLAFTQRPDFFNTKIWWPLEIIIALSTAAVPVFFILSGYLVIGKTREVKENFIKTWYRIVFPLIVFVLLNALVEWYAIYYVYETIPQSVLRTIWTVLSSDLWFLVILGGLYLCNPIWKRIQLTTRRMVALVAITLAVSLLWQAMHFPSGHASLPALLSSLTLYLYGKWWSERKSQTLPFRICAIGLSFLIVSKILLARGYLPQFEVFFTLGWDSVIGITVWHVFFGRSWPLWIEHLCTWLAPLTLGIYLFHPLLISLRRSVFHFEYDYAGMNAYEYLAISWTSIVGLSILASLLVSKIPHLRTIIGLRQSEKKEK